MSDELWSPFSGHKELIVFNKKSSEKILNNKVNMLIWLKNLAREWKECKASKSDFLSK